VKSQPFHCAGGGRLAESADEKQDGSRLAWAALQERCGSLFRTCSPPRPRRARSARNRWCRGRRSARGM